MSELWQKVAAGTYAATFQGHALQVIRNPDFPADTRRYLPVVDGEPIDTPKSTLRSAQTAACQHVTRQISSSPSGASSRPAPIIDGDFDEVAEPPALPAPEPAPQQPRVTFTITGEVTTADHIAAMTEIRAAFDMLKSVSDVQCRIIPPDFIDL